MGLLMPGPIRLLRGKTVMVLPIGKFVPQAKVLLGAEGPVLQVQGLPGGPRVLLLRGEGVCL